MIYFDNSATTPVREEILDVVQEVLRNHFGNPSSIHSLGMDTQRLFKNARNQIAGFLKVDPGEIVFTSGGTESNNTAVFGALGGEAGGHAITTQFEHASVIEAFKVLESRGFEVTWIKPDASGHVAPEAVEGALRKNTRLVSLIHVNNEIGTIQPIEAVGRILKNHPRTVFHVDGVQSFGKIPVDLKAAGIDLFSFSGHKIHAYKGIGGLYINRKRRLQPLLFGGDQEGGFRPGTENLPGIVSLGEAVGHQQRQLSAASDRVMKISCVILEGLGEIKGLRFNGGPPKTPYIQSVSFRGIPSEVLLHALEEEGLFVSSGSACHSRRSSVSHVLRAIEVPKEYIEGTLRLSYSSMNTLEEAREAVDIIKRTHERISSYL
ncbi:MAG: hypothetical protein AVO33_00620 [delta proteobacterium ML8_F1]|nr:MAG: hypothetical protein AVO33_00620 [delta proteobacterium ML8_F1]